MNSRQYQRLRNLVGRVSSFSEFIEECAKWHRYAVIYPVNWTKANYQWFYNRIKGGYKYVSLFNDTKPA